MIYLWSFLLKDGDSFLQKKKIPSFSSNWRIQNNTHLGSLLLVWRHGKCSYFVWQRNVTSLLCVKGECIEQNVVEMIWNCLGKWSHLGHYDYTSLSEFIYVWVRQEWQTERKTQHFCLYSDVIKSGERVHALFYFCSETLTCLLLAGSIQFWMFHKCNTRLS